MQEILVLAMTSSRDRPSEHPYIRKYVHHHVYQCLVSRDQIAGITLELIEAAILLLVYGVHLPCYGQLTPVKTSIT